ncbi:MAG: hypothetical protein MUD08_13085 [Cytophagales bacterium]|nr:hypothetical protein [Cytophagales bacterium]
MTNPAIACPDHAPDQSGQAFGLPATHSAWAGLSGAGTPKTARQLRNAVT